MRAFQSIFRGLSTWNMRSNQHSAIVGYQETGEPIYKHFPRCRIHKLDYQHEQVEWPEKAARATEILGDDLTEFNDSMKANDDQQNQTWVTHPLRLALPTLPKEIPIETPPNEWWEMEYL